MMSRTLFLTLVAYLAVQLVHGTYPRLKPCICWSWGDPHYRTCDKVKFNFQGKCSYVFSMLCEKYRREKTFYKVTEINEPCGRPGGRVSCNLGAIVELDDYKIKLNGDGTFEVNGFPYTDGYIHAGGLFKVVLASGRRLILKTNFGLVVKYKRRRLKIRVPPTYAGKLCGLCGNYNGNPKDDFVTRDGEDVYDKYTRNDQRANEVGQSWLQADYRSEFPECRGECESLGHVDKCKPELLLKALFLCRPINPANKQGPFYKCLSANLENAQQEYEDCILDVCHEVDPCDSFKDVDSFCQDKGFMSPTWREVTKCALCTDENTVYHYLANACDNTCKNPNAADNCPEQGQEEGCVCKEGYVKENGKCIPEDQCGCTTSNQEYIPDGTSYTRNCEYKRVCNGTTGEVCEGPYACENCTKTDGKWMCADGAEMSTVCEHETMTLACADANEVLTIVTASYGRNDDTTCTGDNRPILTTTCSAVSSLGVVQSTCNGVNQCSVLAENSVFGDPCVGTFKYLVVEYLCA